MPRRGPRVKAMSFQELEYEVRRMVRAYEDITKAGRLLRFAVEFEKAIYEGRIDPDRIPRDVLMLLVEPRPSAASEAA